MSRLYAGCWTVALRYPSVPNDPASPIEVHVTPPDTYEEAELVLRHIALGAPVEYIRGVPTIGAVHYATSAKVLQAPAARICDPAQ